MLLLFFDAFSIPILNMDIFLVQSENSFENADIKGHSVSTQETNMCHGSSPSYDQCVLRLCVDIYRFIDPFSWASKWDIHMGIWSGYWSTLRTCFKTQISRVF